MKLILNNNYSRYRQHYRQEHNVGNFQPPKNNLNNNNNNDISFTSAEKFSKIISKKTGEVIYTNASAIINSLDKTFGEGYFSKLLQSANITPSENKLKIKDLGFFRKIADNAKQQGILHAVADTVTDIPARIIIGISRGLGKFDSFKNASENILKSNFISKKLNKFELAKNFGIITEILEEFTDKKLATALSTKTEKYFSLQNSASYLRNKASEGITKKIKNYSSRDERTINRLATGVVSSIFGGWDFYNLSMVQKNDKNEAKKAQKERFFVELKKYATSAGFTFLTLGALNKYIKNSMFLNVAAILGSSILSEIFSKVTSGTPIIPLTPEKAKAIAQKRKSKENNNKTFNEAATKNIPLKGHKELIPREKQVFGKFISKDGSFAALNALNNQYIKNSKENPKKKTNVLKLLGIGAAVASVVYLVSCYMKGEYRFNKDFKDIFIQNKDKINKFLNGESDKLDDDLISKINKALSEKKDFKNKFDKIDIFSKIKDAFTKKTAKLDINMLKAMKDKLSNLSETEGGEKIKDLLNKYIKDLDGIIAKGKDFKITEKEYKVRSGFYNGLTKIPKTIYQIFSLPGLGVKTLMNETAFKDSQKAWKKINSITGIDSSVKDEISKLYEILIKDGLDDAKIIKDIAEKTRKLSTGPETGELANYARTCVTFISSLFFINDYRNKVLIESEGKDTKKASEEVGTRVTQKAFNFVINGTLMNLFNSIFEPQLNASLFGATWIPALTETVNETLTRKSIFQPILPRNSRQEIVEFEEKQNSKKGIAGWWNKTYKKLTNKKSLTEKAGMNK